MTHLLQLGPTPHVSTPTHSPQSYKSNNTESHSGGQSPHDPSPLNSVALGVQTLIHEHRVKPQASFDMLIYLLFLCGVSPALLPIFKLDCSFSYCWVLRVLCIFWRAVFHHICLWQIFSPSLWIIFFSWCLWFQKFLPLPFFFFFYSLEVHLFVT
jgi:hypothetical protein